MKPKKARTAIIITVVTALIIIAVCLCLLFSFNPLNIFEGKAEPSKNASAADAAPAVTEAPSPSVNDLRGCSDKLYLPKAESYLKSYRYMITRASRDGAVNVLYKPEPKVVYDDVLLMVEDNTKVKAIAQENGYTLILLKEGVVGWVLTYELEES